MIASIITSFLCVVVTFSNSGQVAQAEEVEKVDPAASYLALPIEEWEKESIYTIISTMGEKNILQLGLESKSLKKRGKKINHVHPMRFVGYIFSDPYLKKCMSEVKKSAFKWKGFMRGFSKRMEEEFSKNNLFPYVGGFAEQVGVNASDIQVFIDNKDWDGFINFLLLTGQLNG